jgi:Protein of unknown function (DUF3040)
MALSEHEMRALDGLERALRKDDPDMDRLLRHMLSPGGVVSTVLAVGIVAAFGIGLALLVVGNRYGATVWTVIGATVMVVVPSVLVIWGSRRYYYPGCNHPAAAAIDRCPRCTASAL